MKNKDRSNHHDALATRLRRDANALPACPSSIHTRVMDAISDVAAPEVAPGRADFIRWHRAYPAFAAAALIALVGLAAVSLQQHRGGKAVDVARSEVTPENVEITAINSAVPVQQLPGVLGNAASAPYQAELKHLGRDVQGAARFLISQLGSSVPSSVMAAAEPRG